jgi:hypothetical protein
MAQILLPPWAELYDSVANSVISSTQNTILNGKLYAKLLVSLEDQAFQHMTSRKHFRANGILLLKELQQMYKPRNVPKNIADKIGEFWSQTKCSPHETVDVYYLCFQELLEDLSEADKSISNKSAI